MGLVQISITVSPEDRQAMSLALLGAGALGIEERTDQLIVYATEPEEQRALLEAVRQVAARSGRKASTTIEDVNLDYDRIWQDALVPVVIAEDLVLRPTSKAPAPAGERTLWFQPDVSFGSGDHPTTQLAARRVAELGRRQKPARLLDVGTGTGVLCLVAVRCGFQTALGVDIDDRSVASARRNVALNQLTEQIEVAHGSAKDVADVFPIVCANIISSVLLEIGSDLVRRLEPRGALLLTGLLHDESSEVSAFFANFGLAELSRDRLGDWGLLLLQRDAR